MCSSFRIDHHKILKQINQLDQMHIELRMCASMIWRIKGDLRWEIQQSNAIGAALDAVVVDVGDESESASRMGEALHEIIGFFKKTDDEIAGAGGMTRAQRQ